LASKSPPLSLSRTRFEELAQTWLRLARDLEHARALSEHWRSQVSQDRLVISDFAKERRQLLGRFRLETSELKPIQAAWVEASRGAAGSAAECQGIRSNTGVIE
jgi:hypothetical protein